MDSLLEVKDLSVAFRTRAGVAPAVDGVALRVNAGRTLGVVGESGSGKSVTALSILRLLPPQAQIAHESRITLDGRDLLGLEDEALRAVRGNEIGMIFQEPMTSLNPVLTVGSQICETLWAHGCESRATARTRAVELLEMVGIPEARRRVDDYPHEMSGGMRQRVMIAIAMACDPRLLIADEPTTALDVTIQAQILDVMRGLLQQTRMALLLITHDFGVIADLADDVAVMYAGRIVEAGPVRDVMSAPQHPYTEALLRSIPTIGMRKSRRLDPIPGSVPGPHDWPAGCRFAPRCGYAHGRCRVDPPPPLFPVGRSAAACWLCEDGGRAERSGPRPEAIGRS